MPNENTRQGSPYGLHRVIEPPCAMPQGAWRLDNSLPIYDNEILVEVSTLNIDAASFTQIKTQAKDDIATIEKIVMDIVATRGKHHNPVTGSGGMFIGTVTQIGASLLHRINLKVGDRIASLVSLSLTPLYIRRLVAIHPHNDHIDIEGHAILFETGLYAKLPDDIPEKVALAILDVAGAPAQTARLVKKGDTVVIIGGGGKSGILCSYEAKRQVGANGQVIGVSPFAKDQALMRSLGFVDEVLSVDAKDPIALMQAVAKVTGGQMADVVINCVNIPHTEMASILATKDGGSIYFFSMATSFTAAALGAEGVGKDINMLIGNGYAKGHAEHALSLLRESPKIRQLFAEHYAA